MPEQDLEKQLFQAERHGQAELTVKTADLRTLMERLEKAEAARALAASVLPTLARQQG